MLRIIYLISNCSFGMKYGELKIFLWKGSIRKGIFNVLNVLNVVDLNLQ